MGVQRLLIDLPDSVTAEIRAAIDAGEYASASEAVQDAVELWSEGRRGSVHNVESLRQAWDAGKASGTYGPVDLDEVREEARSRLGEPSAT